jgi:hypothetical protein
VDRPRVAAQRLTFPRVAAGYGRPGDDPRPLTSRRTDRESTSGVVFVVAGKA